LIIKVIKAKLRKSYELKEGFVQRNDERIGSWVLFYDRRLDKLGRSMCIHKISSI